jgi:hypothetical protein
VTLNAVLLKKRAHRLFKKLDLSEVRPMHWRSSKCTRGKRARCERYNKQ